jgi:NADH-quinone oxidoreductase subunit J
MVITGKHILHSAFYLAVTLLCVAIYFVFLRAEYLAAVQVLVYIGSVVVLILFALMLTRTKVGEDTNISNNQKIFASLISVILFASMSAVFYYSKINTVAENASSLKIVSIKEFANILFSKYTLPFEVASVLLLAALVGSVVLAMKEKESGNGTDITDNSDAAEEGSIENRENLTHENKDTAGNTNGNSFDKSTKENFKEGDK